MLKFKDLMERINETRSLYLEEAEELEELSTEKLLAYRKKAREADTNKHHVYADEADKKIKKKTGVYNPNLLQRAKAKLRNEEADQIDELSVNTVRSYYNKAGEQGKKISDKMKMGGGDWSKDGSDTKTLKKRAAGRNMAMKRRSGEVKMSEDAEQTDEALKGNQHKIDANKNGKVDGHDFKILRNAKKARYQ